MKGKTHTFRLMMLAAALGVITLTTAAQQQPPAAPPDTPPDTPSAQPPPADPAPVRPARPFRGGAGPGPRALPGAPPGEYPGELQGAELSDEEVGDILSVLADINPPIAERLRAAMARGDREQVRRMVQSMRERIAEMVEVRRDDPELYRLRLEDFRLTQRTHMMARRIRQTQRDAGAEPAGEAREQLRQSIARHFDVRQAMREHELRKLEQRLAQMRRQLEERAESKDRLIENRVDELLGQSAAPQW